MKDIDFGYCDLHDNSIDENTYTYKGCWGCCHFQKGEDFPYYSTSKVSEKLGVSESTIRRWIKKGKLEGKLFVQKRRTGKGLPSPKKYHIEKKSVEKLEK